jgi:hypothetical protein
VTARTALVVDDDGDVQELVPRGEMARVGFAVDEAA